MIGRADHDGSSVDRRFSEPLTQSQQQSTPLACARDLLDPAQRPTRRRRNGWRRLARERTVPALRQRSAAVL